MITTLHLRAADWYEANGSPALALEHLLSTTTQRDRCRPHGDAAAQTDVQGWPHVDRATVAVGAWRPSDRGLPPTGRDCRLGRGADRADRRSAAVGRAPDAASSDPAPVEGTSFESARRMLRAVMCAAGPEQMLSEASIAVAQEPTWSPWRDTALYLNAEAHPLTGDVDQARPCSQRPPRSQPRIPMPTASCSARPSSHWWRWIVAMERGCRAPRTWPRRCR